MSAPMLEMQGVRSFYGRIEALKGVSIDVRAGEIVALIGANGAGKSTLLMTIFGKPQASEGRILFDGQDITRLAPHRIAHLGLAQSPEGRRIFPRMTVLENLQMGAHVTDGTHFEADLARCFRLFPILEQRQGQRGGTLSGGEQQMLAIARALMSRPRLLLLDEPSLGLAPLIVRQIFDTIREVNRREGMTILLVEQNANLALEVSAEAYVLETGRVVMQGPSARLRDDPRLRATYLGGSPAD